ncbi:DUF3226 domain-containing protein [Brachyspira hampsonii]|uniref:DUF4435 domain-containing protein n=1 Tax=Brachyspira hampsonii 30446 TaxID=1289135 RepID=A0A2U4FDC5_9SPIR|nr:DUF3226 domain-containing protein [Brachyspira hampsonii]EKV57514.1 hypothetical protein A966_05186 [Brachyspira hampsonii 30446]MBW5390433.1 hypothetical protein [Brachyspira hampsonii]MBW5393473.1 hypothetical protein [Brachyspira hampsonii]OEJ20494.1 hypothetical protein A9495_11685 [Brachyspira hampsonii]
MDNNKKYMILVEGIADKKFIKDYIKFQYKIDTDINDNIIIEENGGNSFNDYNINNIKKYIDNNYKLAVIFDADDNFEESKNNIKRNLNIDDNNIFLFPNNNSLGTLEDLLSNIAVIKDIINCFDEYTNCITSIPETVNPAKKAKIYAYLESIKSYDKKTIKEDKRDYTNNNFWNLNDEYLNSLKEFFDSI